MSHRAKADRGLPEASGDPLHGLLKIGEFATRARTNLRTLRYYEELGLLRPAARSRGGFRHYREADVHRVNMIRELQPLGLSLEEIAALLETHRSGEAHSSFVDRVRASLRAQDALLVERSNEIQRRRERISRALEKLADCESCDLHPCAENNFCEPCGLDGRPLPDDLSALF